MKNIQMVRMNKLKCKRIILFIMAKRKSKLKRKIT